MKRATVLCISVFLLLAGAASAQLDQDGDGIGFYADLEGTTNFVLADPGVTFEVYLLATNISCEFGIAAWEMSLWTEGPVTVVGWDIPYQNINPGIYPDFIVGAWPILVWSPCIHLMTIRLQVNDTATAKLFVKHASAPEGGSLGNYLPAYANPADVGDLRSLYPSSGSTDLPVMCINGAAPLPPESVTWGSVKVLYR